MVIFYDPECSHCHDIIETLILQYDSHSTSCGNEASLSTTVLSESITYMTGMAGKEYMSRFAAWSYFMIPSVATATI